MVQQKHQGKIPKSNRFTSWFDPHAWAESGQTVGGLPTQALFWMIVGVAFAIRALILYQLSGNHPAFDQPIVDSRWHYLWAQRIAAGEWLGSEVFYRAPLYPYLLGLWIRVFGDGLWPIRLMQAFVGGLTAGLTFLIAQRAFGRRVGLTAGIIAALYGTLIYYETELLIEVIAVPLGLWAIYLAMGESARSTPRMLRWFAVGVVVGLFAIARPNILLVVPAFWWWAWPPRDGSEGKSLFDRAKGPLILTLGVLLPIIPVTVRNYVVAQDAVLISYQGGVNLWLGNNPNADGLTMQMPEITLDESVEWNEFVSTTDSIASALSGRELRASEVSSFWTGRALNWMLENPKAAIAGWAKKTLYFLGGYEVSDQTDIYAYSRYSSLLNLLISRPLIYIPFGLIAPLGLMGLVLAWRKSQAARPLVGFVVLYALTVILFLATARHRLPVVPIFIVCAALSIIRFWRAFSARRYLSLILPLGALGILLLVLNQRTVERMMTNPAFLHYQMALAQERKGDFEGAAMEYGRALEIEPNHLASRKNLAYALTKMGMYDSAVAMSFSYLRHRQRDAEAYNNIGLAYLGQGDTARAEGSFRVASRENPKLPHPYFNLGNIASARKEYGEALAQYHRAIEADSTFASAYSALALVFVNAANYPQAESLFVAGLRHVPDHAILQANLGSLYLRMDRPKDAIPYLERALYWTPHSIGVRLNLAIAYLSLERLSDGRKQLNEVLARDPSNETATKLIQELDARGENL